MHIVHVTSFYSVSALSPSSEVCARGIAYRAAGHEFSVVVPGIVASVRWTEFGTVVTVPARSIALRKGFVRIPSAIRRALDRLVPDRLEVADRLSFRQLGVWARANSVPAVLFADEIPEDSMSEVALANYDCVVRTPHSQPLDPVAYAALQVMTIQPGVDLEIFTPLRHNSALRDTSGADVILVCAAPLTASGSVSLAIDATRTLAAQGHDVHLVVVGDGPLRSRLERSAQGLPVQFLSTHELSLVERSEVIATADFALITATDSGRQAIALEALASGTPVVMIGPNHHRIDFSEGGGIETEVGLNHIVQAIKLLGNEPVESRRRSARDLAVPFDAMPLARTMIELHESLV